MYAKLGICFHEITPATMFKATPYIHQARSIERQIDIANYWHFYNAKIFKEQKTSCLLITDFDMAEQKWQLYQNRTDLLTKYEAGKNAAHALRKASSALKENLIPCENYRLLCRNAHNINEQSSNGNTALHWCILRSHINFVRVLADFDKVDASVKNKAGFAAIHYAAQKEDPIYLDTLLNRFKADVNMQGRKGLTPLHVAILNKKSRCITYLLKMGADCNIPADNGVTPLELAKTKNITLKTDTIT